MGNLFGRKVGVGNWLGLLFRWEKVGNFGIVGGRCGSFFTTCLGKAVGFIFRGRSVIRACCPRGRFGGSVFLRLGARWCGLLVSARRWHTLARVFGHNTTVCTCRRCGMQGGLG